MARFDDLLKKVLESYEPVSIQGLLTRGIHSIQPIDGLRKLMESRPIKLYLGIDPTSPDLHIGHLVPLRRLRKFQDLGHQVTLLFGTATGMVGDPSGKTTTRSQLTIEEVLTNIQTYVEQVSLVLDMGTYAENPINLVRNGDWFADLSFLDMMPFMSVFTAQQFLAHSTYAERIESGNPLHIHELTYPIMQAYDAWYLGVDAQVGGSDQIFNMLAGRDLIKRIDDRDMFVYATKLLVDPSTGVKIGKTAGNVVNVTEYPEVIYEALMTWPDTAVALGLEMLTDVPTDVVQQIGQLYQEKPEGFNPVEFKEAFASRVILELHGAEAAIEAAEIFTLVKRQKQLPPRMKGVEVSPSSSLSDILVLAGLANDLEEATSLFTQKAVYLDGKKCKDTRLSQGEYVLSIGKKTIKNIRKVIVS